MSLHAGLRLSASVVSTACQTEVLAGIGPTRTRSRVETQLGQGHSVGTQVGLVLMPDNDSARHKWLFVLGSDL